MNRSFVSKEKALTLSVVAISVLGAGGLVHCGSTSDQSASDVAAESAAATSSGASSRNVSFLVASDLHFGYGVDPAGDGASDESEDADDDGDTPDDDEATNAANAKNSRGAIYVRNVALADAMMATKSSAGEKALAKNSISNDFAGVVVTGDIADNGQVQQWTDFKNVFGFDGTGSFKFRMYETWGNHDYPWTTSPSRPFDSPHGVYDVRKIDERDHEAGDPREGFIESDPNGSGAFAWHFGDVLFVNLGVKASDVDGTVIKGPNDTYRYTDPFHSLIFLESVLKDHAKNGNPVVLSFHYPMVTGDDRMTDGERDHLFNVIKGYNIVAILHGHRHVSSKYHWCNIPVLEVSTPRNVRSDKDSTFVAVTIDGESIHAQTVHYKQAGASTVGYDTTCDLMKASKGDSCWTFHQKISSIDIPSTCDTHKEVHDD